MPQWSQHAAAILSTQLSTCESRLSDDWAGRKREKKRRTLHEGYEFRSRQPLRCRSELCRTIHRRLADADPITPVIHGASWFYDVSASRNTRLRACGSAGVTPDRMPVSNQFPCHPTPPSVESAQAAPTRLCVTGSPRSRTLLEDAIHENSCEAAASTVWHASRQAASRRISCCSCQQAQIAAAVAPEADGASGTTACHYLHIDWWIVSIQYEPARGPFASSIGAFDPRPRATLLLGRHFAGRGCPIPTNT